MSKAGIDPRQPVLPVDIRYSFMKILTGSDLSRRRLPVMSAVSTNPGPVVWMTACGHGDEVSGIVIIQEVFKRIRRKLLCGAVHSFPLMNPLGFEARSRNITISGEDLNRSFPGNDRGSLGERIAYLIFNTIVETHPTLVIDLHCDWIQSIPYVLLDRNPGPEYAGAYQKSMELSRETGFYLISDNEVMSRSLSLNLVKRDIPSFTLELGKPLVVSEPNVASGFEAIWNILAKLQMVKSGDRSFNHSMPPQFGEGKILVYSDKPYGSKTGIIRFLAKPGNTVSAGQPIAKIVNAFGRLQETVVAADAAIVLGHSDSSAAFPGMPIMAFGIDGG